MASVDMTRSAVSAAPLTRIKPMMLSIAATCVEWNELRLTRKALGALTDRELDDIGLIRGDIDVMGK